MEIDKILTGNELFPVFQPVVYLDIMSDEDFHEGYTKKLLEKYSIEPHKIILEITEYCSKKNSSLLSEIINHYKIQNFKIALDNVGSAYSGLERICVVNPDFIKIDMNIVLKYYG